MYLIYLYDCGDNCASAIDLDIGHHSMMHRMTQACAYDFPSIVGDIRWVIN